MSGSIGVSWGHRPKCGGKACQPCQAWPIHFHAGHGYCSLPLQKCRYMHNICKPCFSSISARKNSFHPAWFFRIVPSTQHHSASRKSCAVRQSVAASHSCASQTLENHGASRASFPALHRPNPFDSTKKFYTLACSSCKSSRSPCDHKKSSSCRI